jgi:flagellar basal body-associated protein FliL
MIDIIIVLSLTCTVLSEKYILSSGVSKSFSVIQSNQTNIFYCKGKNGQRVDFALTMNYMNTTPFKNIFIYEYQTENSTKYNNYYNNSISFKTDNKKMNITLLQYIYVSSTEYIAFQFTPNCDIVNVNIFIEVSGKTEEEQKAEREETIKNVGNALLTIIIFIALIPFICIAIIIVIVVVMVVQCSKNNVPRTVQTIPPAQPQYYPPQPLYSPPPTQNNAFQQPNLYQAQYEPIQSVN